MTIPIRMTVEESNSYINLIITLLFIVIIMIFYIYNKYFYYVDFRKELLPNIIPENILTTFDIINNKSE